MDSLKRAMRWDERRFGREYDLDIFMIVAVSDFNMGAMENKGLNVFNDKYVLASPRPRPTAISPHRSHHRARIFPQLDRQPHHLPRLVPALPEGRPDGFPRPGVHRRPASRPVKRISDVRLLRGHQFVEDAGPLAHPVRPEMYREINNFYTATVYEKGAEVVRMVKTLIGAGNSARAWIFISPAMTARPPPSSNSSVASPTSSDLDMPAFMRWYAQAGTPEVVANGSWDDKRQDVSARHRQTVPPTPNQPVKQPMLMPWPSASSARTDATCR
jgi:aminopeptidase N